VEKNRSKLWELRSEACLEQKHVVYHRVGRQSAKFFLQSSELEIPQPLTRWRVCPPLVPGGGAHSLAREGVGESRQGYSVYICMYFVLSILFAGAGFFVQLTFCRASCPLDLPSEGRMRLPLSAGGGCNPPPSPVWIWGGENLLY
jgi:hypothetical protein